MGQEASFAVQLNGARGLIDAKIHTPSGAIEECCITELDSGEFVSPYQSLQWNHRTCFLLCESLFVLQQPDKELLLQS